MVKWNIFTEVFISCFISWMELADMWQTMACSSRKPEPK